jgi:hypothetical protein
MSAQFRRSTVAITKTWPQSTQRMYEAGGEADRPITTVRSAVHFGHFRFAGARAWTSTIG